MPGEKAVKADMADGTWTMAELLEGTSFINNLKGEAMTKETDQAAADEKTKPAASSKNEETTETETNVTRSQKSSF